MKKIAHGIYLIINLVNDKKYVGSTGSSRGFNKRWEDHKRELKGNYHRNPHLQSAYNKYGKQNFEFIILEKLSKSHIGNTANLGRKFNKQWRDRISIALRGIKRSEAYKEKMSKIKKQYYKDKIKAQNRGAK